MDIKFDRYSLIIDGQREMIRCGAMHYFRLPHPDLWWDRLKKLKMSGYNTVDIYFNWDFHSKAPGQYNFTGNRDIKRLLDMVESLGLYLIARPGPYINAETTRGGLPGWLLTQPDVVLRNRVDGVYQYSPAYMGFVREWMDQILPFLKGRQNMLMIQIENEYCTEDMEPDYMEELIEVVKSHGIEVPTMHNDFYAAGLYADLVDIYAIDNYSVTAFDLNWRTFPDLFSVMDHLELQTRPEFCENRPLMIAELQAGWFAGWKGVSYDTIHKSLGRDHISLVTRSFLGQGGTIFNHYKAVGGTNWDHIGATDAYTSYDFSAPINEMGLPTERLYEAKRINLLLSHFDLTRTERAEPSEVGLAGSTSLYLVRKDLNHPGAYWIFTRNITPEPLLIEIKPGVVIETLPYQTRMIPFSLPLKNGWLLEALNVEPLVQTENCLILPGSQKVTLDFHNTGRMNLMKLRGNTKLSGIGDNRSRLELANALGDEELVSIQLGETHIHFVGNALADRLWDLHNGHYLLGPDMVSSPEEVYLGQPRACWMIHPDGTAEAMEIPAMDTLAIPALEDWTLVPGKSPWPRDGYTPLSPAGSDMDSNGLYEGAAWYRYEFTGPAETLSFRAQHIWAVFLNGTCLIANHTFHVHPETGGPKDTVTLQLPQDQLNPEGTNVLTIFVESLGHHKGFYDDTRDPRGVLELKKDGEDISQAGWIKPAITSHEEEPVATGTETAPASPILHAVTRFSLSLSEHRTSPIGLELDVDIERVNITLNGLLVGKFWKSCRNQTVFYLPEGILNPTGLNHLELTLMNFLPQLSIEKTFPKAYGKVRLVPYYEMSKLFIKTADKCSV